MKGLYLEDLVIPRGNILYIVTISLVKELNHSRTLVDSSPKLGGDSRRYNARQIESIGWEESQSEDFSRSSLLT